MTASKKNLIKRALLYLLGFILFYAPVALFQRILVGAFKLVGREDIHGVCFRMGIQQLLTGKGISLITTTGIIILLLIITSFFIGPLFCGKLCFAGAISEFISRAVPKKLQFDWQKRINPAPVRYGILAGFLLSPILELSVLCAYCNYSLLQNIIDGVITWNLAALGTSSIITGFIWLIVLGAFAKGGRGYCSYFCPVGAFQSLIHFVGSKFGFTYKLKFAKDKCASCGLCVKDCPMGALQIRDKQLEYNIHDCITCNQCKHVCPKQAITFGRGKANWEEKKRLDGQIAQI